MQRNAILVTTLVAIGGWLALGAFAQDQGDVSRGKRIFFDTGEFQYPSCALCHATVAPEKELEKTGHVRPGHPVYDTYHRGAWKNFEKGKGPKTAAEAGNLCVVAFQKRKKLPASDLQHLGAYLASISPSADKKPLKIGYAPKLPETLDGGDPERGRKKVETYCGGCHGKTDDHFQYELRKGKIQKQKLVRKVRGWIEDPESESGLRFKPDKGQMSFFAKDRLPDKDLLDIVAYLGRD